MLDIVLTIWLKDASIITFKVVIILQSMCDRFFDFMYIYHKQCFYFLYFLNVIVYCYWRIFIYKTYFIDPFITHTDIQVRYL